MNSAKKIIIPLITLGFLLVSSSAFAADNPGPAGLQQLQELFQRFINISVGLAFIALLIMIIFAGIKFLTSGGEPKALGQASAAITWALLGILFLVIAWLILKLIAAFTGVDVTKVCFNFAGCP